MVACVVIPGGCAGYRLGSQLPPGIRTVYVHIARNNTEEPLLETDVTNAVLAQLQRDGSLRVVGEDQADSQMYLEITDFRLEPLRFEAENRTRPDEYRLTIRANTTLVRGSDGVVMVRSGNVEGRSTFFLQGDLTASKRTALPDAARDLARHLVSAVTEAWPD
ncbi:MAG: LptE family protein [Verrucomicrobia bacterium]|nr:LptE family protein [Verrucomicrobiota bacterium]